MDPYSKGHVHVTLKVSPEQARKSPKGHDIMDFQDTNHPTDDGTAPPRVVGDHSEWTDVEEFSPHGLIFVIFRVGGQIHGVNLRRVARTAPLGIKSLVSLMYYICYTDSSVF